MTRIGLIGCGKWGRNAARAMAKAGVLAWVSDPNGEAAFKLGQEFNVPYYDDLDALLAECKEPLHVGATGCWVASPIETHELLVHRLLGEGLHVLCEKPLARIKAQAEMLADEAKRRGLVLMADHTWLGHHSARVVVDAEGVYKYSAARMATDDRGFDAVEDLMPHDIALACRAMGPARRIVCHPSSRTMVSVEHERGFSSLDYAYDFPGKVRRMESWAKGGAYRVTEGALPEGAPEPLTVVLTAFLDAIRTGTEPTIGSADEFVHVAAVIEAAKKSRASGGGWVDVV